MNLYFRLLAMMLRSSRQPPTGPWDPAVTRFRVAPADLDIFKHMTNGRYPSIMDIARIDLLRRSGLWAAVKAVGWYPVVAGQTITYRKPLGLGERFDVRSVLLGLESGWVYFEHTVLSKGHVHAHAIVRVRVLRRAGGSVGQQELEALAGSDAGDHPVPAWILDWTETAAASR